MTEWLSLRELAEAAGITESTARRYVRLFDSFLVADGEGRARRWRPDSIQVLVRIADLYAAGHVTDSIQKQLAKEIPQIIDSEESSPPATTTASVPESVKQLLAFMSKQAEELAELRNEVATLRHEQEDALKQLADRQAQTAAAIEALETIQKTAERREEYRRQREEERDRKLMEVIRGLQEARRPWWRRLLG